MGLHTSLKKDENSFEMKEDIASVCGIFTLLTALSEVSFIVYIFVDYSVWHPLSLDARFG